MKIDRNNFIFEKNKTKKNKGKGVAPPSCKISREEEQKLFLNIIKPIKILLMKGKNNHGSK